MNSPRILCITPNPAIDRTMVLPRLVPGGVHRSYRVVVDAGGKGVNVARAVQILGGRAICAGFLGGLSGERLARLAAAEGFDAAWTVIADETRTCVILATEDGQDATVLNENGPSVTPQEWENFHADIVAALSRCDLVCASGSLPADSPPAALAQLIRSVEQAGTPIWVDTSGAALHAALDAAPSMIKVNQHEMADVFGTPVESAADAVTVAGHLRARGIRNVAITLGRNGAVLATAEGAWWAQPPHVAAISAVGSGDSFFAGLATAAGRGEPWDVTLRWAVAAGTANTLSPGGGRFRRDEFDEILRQIGMERLVVH